MDYRQLGGSGFKVPALCLGTGTFGGRGEFFKAWGGSDVAEATRLVDICLEAGLTMFDSADGYSGGAAEEILGQAIRGRRDQVITVSYTHLDVYKRQVYVPVPGDERQATVSLNRMSFDDGRCASCFTRQWVQAILFAPCLLESGVNLVLSWWCLSFTA